MNVQIGVVLVAAGDGQRLGRDGPKALLEVGGRTLLGHALAGLVAAGLPPPVVVHAPGQAEGFENAVAGVPVAGLVAGGETRTASVRAGVAALGDTAQVVAIHDAARPLMPPAAMRTAVTAVVGAAAVADADAVVAAAPACPVADTLKRVDADGVVLATVDRSDLVAVQTPQVFRRHALETALAIGTDATDELVLVEELIAQHRLAGRVVTVPGSVLGMKLTYPDDLVLLEALARSRT